MSAIQVSCFHTRTIFDNHRSQQWARSSRSSFSSTITRRRRKEQSGEDSTVGVPARRQMQQQTPEGRRSESRKEMWHKYLSRASQMHKTNFTMKFETNGWNFIPGEIQEWIVLQFKSTKKVNICRTWLSCRSQCWAADSLGICVHLSTARRSADTRLWGKKTFRITMWMWYCCSFSSFCFCECKAGRLFEASRPKKLLYSSVRRHLLRGPVRSIDNVWERWRRIHKICEAGGKGSVQ